MKKNMQEPMKLQRINGRTCFLQPDPEQVAKQEALENQKHFNEAWTVVMSIFNYEHKHELGKDLTNTERVFRAGVYYIAVILLLEKAKHSPSEILDDAAAFVSIFLNPIWRAFVFKTGSVSLLAMVQGLVDGLMREGREYASTLDQSAQGFTVKDSSEKMSRKQRKKFERALNDPVKFNESWTRSLIKCIHTTFENTEAMRRHRTHVEALDRLRDERRLNKLLQTELDTIRSELDEVKQTSDQPKLSEDFRVSVLEKLYHLESKFKEREDQLSKTQKALHDANRRNAKLEKRARRDAELKQEVETLKLQNAALEKEIRGGDDDVARGTKTKMISVDMLVAVQEELRVAQANWKVKFAGLEEDNRVLGGRVSVLTERLKTEQTQHATALEDEKARLATEHQAELESLKTEFVTEARRTKEETKRLLKRLQEAEEEYRVKVVEKEDKPTPTAPKRSSTPPSTPPQLKPPTTVNKCVITTTQTTTTHHEETSSVTPGSTKIQKQQLDGLLQRNVALVMRNDALRQRNAQLRTFCSTREQELRDYCTAFQQDCLRCLDSHMQLQGWVLPQQGSFTPGPL